MSHIYRCSRCRTRNTFPRALSSYLRPKACRDCGHTSFYADKERAKRLPCRCDGYHYAHRPGSPCCDQHAFVDMHRAKRAGMDFDDMVLAGVPLPRTVGCPF